MKAKYAIGIDFGTESGRAVLVNLADGTEEAEHVTPYPHGVIDQLLPHSGMGLDYDWALQHPGDYLEVLRQSVPAVLRESGIHADQVVGLGIDFTACTMLPVDEQGEPLCMKPGMGDHPHSWVKLWKHHGAQQEADRINATAAARQEPFLSRYGGKVSSEWMLPKAWQILNDAPEIYEQADRFVEAADWVVWQMTGILARNSCTAGYKSLWHKRDGYPSRDFLQALDLRLEDLTETKLRGEVHPLGSRAGGLTVPMARLTGLNPGTAVAVGIIDAHAAVPGSGVVSPGRLVMAMGTSICHMLLSEHEVHVEGVCGVVEDGIIEGYYGYEAGQAAVGDMFGWYVRQAAPGYAEEEARAAGVGLHQWLEEKATAFKPGETGLLALDWWNGNRSVLADTSLSGMLAGFTLSTKPEEIYRALLEAAAFGTRRIIDAFQEAGVAVEELVACGGLPRNNALLMQIYADVTNREIRIASSRQTPALGAAMFAAVAAGAEAGGYDTIQEAAARMARVRSESVKPIPEHAAVYEKLYQEYRKLHDYFGRGDNSVLKQLGAIRREVPAGR